MPAKSTTSSPSRRINFLMKNRHGTPFEHTFFKFFIDADLRVPEVSPASHRVSQTRSRVGTAAAPEVPTSGPARAIKQVGKPGAHESRRAPMRARGRAREIRFQPTGV